MSRRTLLKLRLITFFWRFIHNAVAHPLLIWEGVPTIKFHDWTAKKWDIANARAETASLKFKKEKERKEGRA